MGQAGVAQLAEQRFRKPQVGGSIPLAGSRSIDSKLSIGESSVGAETVQTILSPESIRCPASQYFPIVMSIVLHRSA